MATTEEAFGSGGAVGATDVIVVDGRQGRELTATQAVTAMMVEGALTVAALHAGAAALEQIGAAAGDRFEVPTGGERQGLQRMRRLAYRTVR